MYFKGYLVAKSFLILSNRYKRLNTPFFFCEEGRNPFFAWGNEADIGMRRLPIIFLLLECLHLPSRTHMDDTNPWRERMRRYCCQQAVY